MQAEAAAKLDLLLIPESYITPSQYQDSRVGNQVRLTADQRLILAVLADGIEAFKDFFQRGEVLRWINSNETTPVKSLPFLFCIAALGLELDPMTARKIYLDKCRNYSPTVIRTTAPAKALYRRSRQDRALALSA
jgi:hypothetical protein